MDKEIDYTAVLADLKAKRNALDAVIGGLEQWLSLKGSEVEIGPANSGTDRTGAPGEVRSDSFFGQSIPDAIRKCLKIMKRPLGLTEITKALQEGGLLTSAKDLTSTVSATLTRIRRTDGDLVQVQRKWGLAEWYPGMRKERVEGARKGKRGRKRGRPKIRAAKDESKSATPKTEAKKRSAKPTDEQLAQIKKLHDAGKGFGEIAEILGLQTLSVWRALKLPRLAKRGSGERTDAV